MKQKQLIVLWGVIFCALSACSLTRKSMETLPQPLSDAQISRHQAELAAAVPYIASTITVTGTYLPQELRDGTCGDHCQIYSYLLVTQGMDDTLRHSIMAMTPLRLAWSSQGIGLGCLTYSGAIKVDLSATESVTLPKEVSDKITNANDRHPVKLTLKMRQPPTETVPQCFSFFDVVSADNVTVPFVPLNDGMLSMGQFTARVPKGWFTGVKGSTFESSLFAEKDGESVAQFFCPIPEWDAGLGWGEFTTRTRTIMKEGKTYTVRFRFYANAMSLITLMPSDTPEDASGGVEGTCAFLGTEHFSRTQAEKVFLTLE